jgi:hypothetical protein
MSQLYTPHRVSALPATLAPNAIYYLPTGVANELQIVVTGLTAEVVYATVTRSDIQALIDSAAGLNQEILVTPTITTRAAMTWAGNGIVLVGDATDDPEIDAGAAIYFYNAADQTYTLTARLADLYIVQDWGDILNIPPAVSGLGVDANGNLTFGGNVMGMYFETTEW